MSSASHQAPEAISAGRRRREPTTADRILDVAEALVQERGFNGVSYAHIASQLGITKASLHYHFATKAALGEALIERYAGRFSEALAAIDEERADAREKLSAYAELYAGVLRRERMCLCGILAAEYRTLPAPMCAAIVRFFDANERWLARVLADGREQAVLVFGGGSDDAARALLAGLEGAMLVARPYGDDARFESAAKRLLSSLERR
jgi:TetR/AcrR family transcriptional repressor of nem operon